MQYHRNVAVVARDDERHEVPNLNTSFPTYEQACRAIDLALEPPAWRCAECKGTNVQISMPAWFDPNTDAFIEQDAEAEPLSVFCTDCGTQVEIVKGDRRQAGRWD